MQFRCLPFAIANFSARSKSTAPAEMSILTAPAVPSAAAWANTDRCQPGPGVARSVREVRIGACFQEHCDDGGDMRGLVSRNP